MSTSDPICAGNAAAEFTTSLTPGLRAGDTITVEWATRPGCEQQTVAVAGYSTAHDLFDSTENQPIIASTRPVPLGTHGQLNWTVPPGIAPACRIQLDVFTGAVHPQIDGAHRYNKPAAGLEGGNDLIAAAYATDPACGTATTVVREDPIPPALISTTVPTTVSPPSSTVVEPGSPGTTQPPVPGEPTLYAQCVTSLGVPCGTGLPVTGADLSAVALIGVVTLVLAAAAFAGSRHFRRSEA